MAKKSKYTKKQIVQALKMYSDGEPMINIKEKLRMTGAGWQSVIYFWRNQAGIAKRETKRRKWENIKKEVEK
jgi:predicted Ser/Thr protein kinase